eukprot:s1080_g6.t1
MRRAAAAKAAPGGKNGSLGGEPLELEKLPPQEVLVNIYDVAGFLQLQSLRKSKIQELLKKAYAGAVARLGFVLPAANMGCGASTAKVMDFDPLSTKAIAFTEQDDQDSGRMLRLPRKSVSEIIKNAD